MRVSCAHKAEKSTPVITKTSLVANLSYCRSDIHVVFICTILYYFTFVLCFSALGDTNVDSCHLLVLPRITSHPTL